MEFFYYGEHVHTCITKKERIEAQSDSKRLKWPFTSKEQDVRKQGHLSKEFLNSKMWQVWLYQFNLNAKIITLVFLGLCLDAIISNGYIILKI